MEKLDHYFTKNPKCMHNGVIYYETDKEAKEAIKGYLRRNKCGPDDGIDIIKQIVISGMPGFPYVDLLYTEYEITK